MHISFKTGWHGMYGAIHQWLAHEEVRQSLLHRAKILESDQTESSRINELPDRGRDSTKTVTDPHSKPVQE